MNPICAAESIFCFDLARYNVKKVSLFLLQIGYFMAENQSENIGSRRHKYGRILPGSILLVLGIVFLLSNYGIIQGDIWGKLWPLFLIVPGLLILFGPDRNRPEN